MFKPPSLAVLFVSFLLAAFGGLNSEGAESPAGGVKWRTFEEALALAGKAHRPLMVAIQKPWCSACATLDREIAQSDAFQKLGKNFVLARLESEEETGTIFQLDGKYYPRVFFLDHRGDILEHVQNFGSSGSPTAKYFYSTADDLVEAMRRALDLSSHSEL